MSVTDPASKPTDTKIRVREYVHLDNPDVMALIVGISTKNEKTLSKMNKFVVGQLYSSKRQALNNINQVVERLKSKDEFDDYMIVGKFSEIIANQRLEDPVVLGKFFSTFKGSLISKSNSFLAMKNLISHF